MGFNQAITANVSISSSALATSTGDFVTGAAYNYKIGGTIYAGATAQTIDLSAATLQDGASLTIPNTEFVVITCTVDAAGAYKAYVASSAATLAECYAYEGNFGDESIIGGAIIENDSGVDYVTGTTALSAVTITYLNNAGVNLLDQ